MIERERLQAFFSQEVQSHNAHISHSDDKEEALKAVCQAIVWACALDAFRSQPTTPGSAAYRTLRRSETCGQHLEGVRYARSRAAHQAAELVRVVERATFPAFSPVPLFEITWRLAAALPAPETDHLDRAGEDAYIRLLQDQPVRFTFDALARFFKHAA